MPRSASSPDVGVLLCDKPAGVTSHDVVAQVRRERKCKAGHAGTLDPFATGLLIVLLGRATRLQRYLLGLPKTYRAVARLGWRSSTGDPDGELTETGVLPAELRLPSGSVNQRLPMTSAVHVEGERLYKRAHRGEVIETPERQIFVHRAELISSSPERAQFEIECSSGTYVRTLIETLGDAYCEQLRRTRIGDFDVADAGDEPLPVERALSFLPERPLDPGEAQRVRNGIAPPAAGEPVGPLRLTHEGRLLAVAGSDEQGLRLEVVLAPASN